MKKATNDQIIISKAMTEEVKVIQDILKVVKLPFNDISLHIHNLLVMKKKKNIIGAIGFEVYDKYALLRSFSILPEFQGIGMGRHLYNTGIMYITKLNVDEIYLLTETEDRFFTINGFEKCNRNKVPKQIKNTNEFKSVRCEKAVCMKLKLVNHSTRYE